MSYEVIIDWSYDKERIKWSTFDNHIINLCEVCDNNYLKLWASEIEKYGGRVIEETDRITRLYFESEAHYTWFLLRWS